jgi:hypothetical protein
MKSLFLAILLALPLAGGWFLRNSERNNNGAGYVPVPENFESAHPGSVVTIPVEVVASGRPPEWVLVQVVDNSTGAVRGQTQRTP